MTRPEALALLKGDKEIVALNKGSHAVLLFLALDLRAQGLATAKIVKGYHLDEQEDTNYDSGL